MNPELKSELNNETLLKYLQDNRYSDVMVSMNSSIFEDRPMFNELKGKSNLVGIEVGVQFGVNAKRILDELDIKKLYLIDIFETPEIEEFCKFVLQDYKDKIVFIKDWSANAINKIYNKVDFCYIDASHSYEDVKKDIDLYYPKVKLGGIFGGHDYCKREVGVRTAVDKFGEELKYSIIKKNWDWFIIKEKKNEA
jgi:hypothetical protein